VFLGETEESLGKKVFVVVLALVFVLVAKIIYFLPILKEILI